jgi:hypothetical protein
VNLLTTLIVVPTHQRRIKATEKKLGEIVSADSSCFKVNCEIQLGLPHQGRTGFVQVELPKAEPLGRPHTAVQQPGTLTGTEPSNGASGPEMESPRGKNYILSKAPLSIVVTGFAFCITLVCQ